MINLKFVFFLLILVKCTTFTCAPPLSSVSPFEKEMLKIKEDVKFMNDPVYVLQKWLAKSRVVRRALKKELEKLEKRIWSLEKKTIVLQDILYEELELPISLIKAIDRFFSDYLDLIKNHPEDELKLKKQQKHNERDRLAFRFDCEHIFNDLEEEDYSEITNILNDLEREFPLNEKTRRIENLCRAVVDVKLHVNQVVYKQRIQKNNGKIKAFPDNLPDLNTCINIFYDNAKPIEYIRYEERTTPDIRGGNTDDAKSLFYDSEYVDSDFYEQCVDAGTGDSQNSNH